MIALFALQTDPFKDDRNPLLLKTVKIQPPLSIPTRSHIDIDTLSSIVALCDSFSHPKIFKALYLLCYFSFLRLSNLLLHTTTSFDPTGLEQILLQFMKGQYFLLKGVRP